MPISEDKNARKGDESKRAQGAAQEQKAQSKDFGTDDAASIAMRKPSSAAWAPYIEGGLQLIPLHRWNAVDGKGRPRGKTPTDGAWGIRDYSNDAVVMASSKNGNNVGVRLPPSVMVLDVDPRNFADGVDSLLALVLDTGLDLKNVPQTATGSGGAHYWFNKPIDVSLLDSLADYPGVEFKSHGRQVVAAGSIHPNGTEYKWVTQDVDLRELPDIPPALLGLIRRPTRSHGESAGFGELTTQQLAETLEQLDPADFAEHDEWFLLMASCHHATAGDGRQEFIDWSTGDATYADDGWIIGRRWDSLHMAGTGHGKPITVRYLHKVVQAHGGQVAVTDPADDFEVWQQDVPDGFGVDDDLLRSEPKAEGIDAVIEELNAKHYVVLDNGFEIVTEKMDPVLRRVIYQRLSKSDFLSLYDNRQVELGNNKLVSVANLWLKSARRRQYEGVIFDPEQEHPGWLNLWKGWSVEPKQGDWSLLKELIRTVLVDGDNEGYEYVMNWMAYMVQHPGRPAEVTLAFRGDKGTGKGTLGRALADLAGGSGLHISSPEHITGRFNSHLRNCILLFADEAFWAGDKAGESKLKQLVTEPTIAYEAKGRDLATGRNLIHIVMASNNDWVVPAGLGDERRFAVFEVNNLRQGDKRFFGALNDQMRNGGLSAMLYELKLRPIGNWHPRNDIPQNGALTSQKVKTLGQDPLKLWWFDVLEQGVFPFPIDPDKAWATTPIELASSDKAAIIEQVNIKARQLNKRGDYTMTAVTQAVRRLGVNVAHKDKRGNRGWLVPRLCDARKAFDAWLGGAHTWED